jgi:hypothetical protein
MGYNQLQLIDVYLVQELLMVWKHNDDHKLKEGKKLTKDNLWTNIFIHFA